MKLLLIVLVITVMVGYSYGQEETPTTTPNVLQEVVTIAVDAGKKVVDTAFKAIPDVSKWSPWGRKK